jgi:hypothetical protein
MLTHFNPKSRTTLGIKIYQMSQESQAIEVSRLDSSSIFADPLRILQPSPSKQITAYKMIKCIRIIS